MSSWRHWVAAIFAGVLLFGCQSRLAELAKCRQTCDSLDEEYRAQCKPDDLGCTDDVAQHREACRQICDLESAGER